MNGKTFEDQKKLMRDVLLLFLGATVVLLLTAVEGWEGGKSAQMIQITGWYGVWLVLQFASLVFIFLLFVAKGWRQVPYMVKSNLFYGFSAIAWLNLLSLDMRLVKYSTGYWHGVVIVLGLVLLTVFLIPRLRERNQGEIFP